MSVPIEEQQNQQQEQQQEQQQQSLEPQSLEPQRLEPQSLEPQSREPEEPQRHEPEEPQSLKSSQQEGNSSNQKKIVTFSGSSFEGVSDSDDEESGQPLRPNHSLTTVSSSSPLAARIESKHCLDAAKQSPQKSPKKEKED